jgi:hypothetical protein
MVFLHINNRKMGEFLPLSIHFKKSKNDRYIIPSSAKLK